VIDLTDPIDAFPALRDEHAQKVHDYFEGLVAQSGVDESENTRTIAELRSLEQMMADSRSSVRKLRLLQVLSVVLALVLTIVGAVGQGAFFALWVVAIIGPIWAFTSTGPKVSRLKIDQADLEHRRAVKAAEAAAQMAPLNALHKWGVSTALVHAVIPELRFSWFLRESTVRQLYAEFGLPNDFTNGRSMLALQSGSFRGNPFVLARYRHHWIGPFVYHGSLVIHWTERVRNSSGRMETVHRSQTLTATVTKPHPYFAIRTTLIFGHHAVPGLNFSRSPSRLSGLDDGTINDWRKERAVKKVERKARQATSRGTSGFTVVANTEFEALFKAHDRNDEVGFRAFFTALAQGSMLKILNDNAVGFGDDFAFRKHGKINMVEPTHVAATDITASPSIFESLSLADARAFFADFNTDYFKSIYFTFAPLWAIPLLHDEPPPRPTPAHSSAPHCSTWEQEVLANHIGDESFRHPDSITENILRASAHPRADGTSTVTVTATGYAGAPRVDYIPVYGGDGNWHDVPVHWTEYTAVSRDSSMLVGPVHDSAQQARWQSALHSAPLRGPSIRRGGLAAALLT